MTAYIYNMGLRFKEIARAYSGNPAISFAGGESLTYAALDEMSDYAAMHLRKAGAGENAAVAIFADKRPMTYVTMLAALKIGAPYVVLDTASPAARLDKILERCQPAVIVANEGFVWRNVPVLSPDALSVQGERLPLSAIRAVGGNAPAYLMFTSGSTGFPKGVTVSHASMLNFCHWARETFAVTPQDVLSNVNPLYFDNSVFDVTASLFNGACLRPVDKEALRQPKQLVEETRDCTVWFSVPSLLIYISTLKALNKESWPNMRAIIFGGEGFAKGELKKLYALYGKQATLWNVYGPTECTCICSAYAISEEDFAQMEKLAPLGRLAPNFSGAVMDESGTKEVEPGETGELFLMGPQVSLGYYNDPERTKAAFAPSPLSQRVAQPCYRTGDLVWRDAANGYYHFAGRKDNQIKHMGYRIELEEIESALNGIAQVAQAAAIYHRTERAGRIVAFVKASDDEQGLKTKLREMLPSYMIPEEIHALDELPKNANGKVDRKALAAQYGEKHA